MKNLTKLVCDLLSLGTQLRKAETSEEVVYHLVHFVLPYLPKDCEVDLDAINSHIASLRGADNDIDKPLSITRVTEFHNRVSVLLSNGRVLSFDTNDIVHY